MNFRIFRALVIAILALTTFVGESDVTSAATKFSRLHAFAGGSDGGSPAYGLISDASSALYGTTEIEASCPSISASGSGCGTVFKLTPPATQGGAWSETILYAFTGGSDGGRPR